MTDNGNGYRSPRTQHSAAELGIRHLLTQPYRPKTNGKAERFIQTLLREWAYAAAYPTSAARRRALPGFLRRYNTTRPHKSLGGDPAIPATRRTDQRGCRLHLARERRDIRGNTSRPASRPKNTSMCV